MLTDDEKNKLRIIIIATNPQLSAQTLIEYAKKSDEEVKQIISDYYNSRLSDLLQQKSEIDQLITDLRGEYDFG